MVVDGEELRVAGAGGRRRGGCCVSGMEDQKKG